MVRDGLNDVNEHGMKMYMHARMTMSRAGHRWLFPKMPLLFPFGPVESTAHLSQIVK